MEGRNGFEMHRFVDETFKGGILKFATLNMINKHHTYPYKLYKKMKTFHFGVLSHVEKSEVYNALNSLETKGLVKSRIHLKGSKVQKEYSLTPIGKKVLTRSRKAMLANLRNIKKLINYEFE